MLTRRVLLAAVVATVVGCAGALAVLGTIVTIAETARQWITRVEKHVSPHLTEEIAVARKVADEVEQCGRAAQNEQVCETVRRHLQEALEKLFSAGRPYGVRVEQDEALFGVTEGGEVLGVPSPESIASGQVEAPQ